MTGGEKKAIPIGLHAVIQQLDLKLPRPIVRSELASGARKTKITNAEILQQYPRSYQPAEGIIGQLRFALKYEPLDLGVYKRVFARIPKTDMERWIQSEPNGIFARRAWYLYEMFTEATLDVADLTSGPYIDLLDQDLHLVGLARRIRRQRVFDNLLGNRAYCPLIRRTEKLNADLKKNLTERTLSNRSSSTKWTPSNA